MLVSVIGFIAAILTAVCQIPQLIKIIRTHHTKDISFPTYTILNIGVFLWVIYGLLIHDRIIILANFFTFLVVLFILILKIRYK